MSSASVSVGSRVTILQVGLPRFAISRDQGMWFLLIAVAALIRLPHLGDPAFHIDEEYYLLMGDRLLHGVLPYVGDWDRKPIGLFLIFAGIRLLGGMGIYQYQMVATLFAAVTAWLIYHLAQFRAGVFAGAMAGIAYLIWIETVDGGGGQAPVFYNPLVAGAAWAVWMAMGAPDRRRFVLRAAYAMALIGLAIQIKYTVLFEGLYFGLVLSWQAWKRMTPPVAVLCAGALAMLALLPTLLALAVYAGMGQFNAFWFANFVSINLRGSPVGNQLHVWLRQDLEHTAVLGGCLLAGVWQLRTATDPFAIRWTGLVVGWTAAAFIGFAALGMFFCHYLLPVYVPLAIGAAPAFRRWPVGPALAIFTLWLPLRGISYPDFAATTRSQQQVAALVRLIPPTVDRQCMHIINGPPILYHLTHACTKTRFIFPDHLIGRIEAHALGINAAAELDRVLHERPAALVIGDDESGSDPASLAVLTKARQRLFRKVGHVDFETGVSVWVPR